MLPRHLLKKTASEWDALHMTACRNLNSNNSQNLQFTISDYKLSSHQTTLSIGHSVTITYEYTSTLMWSSVCPWSSICQVGRPSSYPALVRPCCRCSHCSAAPRWLSLVASQSRGWPPRRRRAGKQPEIAATMEASVARHLAVMDDQDEGTATSTCGRATPVARWSATTCSAPRWRCLRTERRGRTWAGSIQEGFSAPQMFVATLDGQRGTMSHQNHCLVSKTRVERGPKVNTVLVLQNGGG